MITDLRKYWIGFMWFFFGLGVSDIVSDIRLSNPLLWREFKIVTENGINGYFTTFAIFPLFLFLVMLVFYFVSYLFRGKKQQGGRKRR